PLSNLVPSASRGFPETRALSRGFRTSASGARAIDSTCRRSAIHSAVERPRSARAAMPETLTCPECHRKVRLPDHLIGKRVKCPSCGGTFTATPATTSVPAIAAVPEPAPFEPMTAPPPPPPPYEEQAQDELAFPR